MPNTHYNADGLPVVVLTVAAKAGLTDLLAEAVTTRHWNVTYSHHKDYVSSTRRPALGQGARSQTHYIAFIDFDGAVAEASEAARYLSQTLAGQITVVATGSSVDADVMLAAMRSGCGEFLSKPTADSLSDLLDRIETRWFDAGGAERGSQGSILSVFGTKGGVGTTTLAVHLAIFLVQCHEKRVLLIDQRPELGHVCVYLGMDGARCHLQEVVRNFNRLDSELLRGFVGHHASGLDVLSSPDVSGSGIAMNAEAVSRTLGFLRLEYDYVVIDCVQPLDTLCSAVFEASSQVFLVATPEIGAVRDLSRYIDRFAPLDGFADKLKLVLNRAATPHAIHVDQIEKAVKLPITLRVPDCYADLVRSENLGEPISPQAKSDLAEALVKWTDSIVGTPSRIKLPRSKPGLLSMLKQNVPQRVAVTRAQ